MTQINTYSLCSIPFSQNASKGSGKVRLCCISQTLIKENNEPTNFGKNDISEIWDSSTMTDIRQRMIAGERIPECAVCWSEEDKGKFSKRLKENKKYLNQIQDRIKYASENNGRLDHYLPFHLDIRPGNTCNLKCRMCHPSASSLYAKEIINDWSDEMILEFPEYKTDTEKFKEWHETEVFWRNIDKIVGDLKELYVTGGEPTISKTFLALIDKCIEYDVAKDMKLRFNTNLMAFNTNLIEKMKCFKSISLDPSVDAYGDKLSYLRHPINWEIFEKNFIKSLQTDDNVDIDITVTVNIMNVLYLNELHHALVSLSHAYNKEITFSYDLVHDPKYLAVNNLTDNLKNIANERLELMLREWPDLTDLKSIISFVNEPSDKHQQQQFKFFTESLDNIRNESFVKTFPEMKEMINER